jgi:hypothetical protein
MKLANVFTLTASALGLSAVAAHADIYTITSSTSVIISTPSVSAVPATNAIPAGYIEHEGDWSVIRGQVSLDRPTNSLTLADASGNTTHMFNNDKYEIYRDGKRVSYFELNDGDRVKIRYKGI